MPDPEDRTEQLVVMDNTNADYRSPTAEDIAQWLRENSTEEIWREGPPQQRGYWWVRDRETGVVYGVMEMYEGADGRDWLHWLTRPRDDKPSWWSELEIAEAVPPGYNNRTPGHEPDTEETP